MIEGVVTVVGVGIGLMLGTVVVVVVDGLPIGLMGNLFDGH